MKDKRDNNCMLGEDYSHECEMIICPKKELCRRLSRQNDKNIYQN